jgi:alpha-glucosidase (family GH31 glycosyl hydrolase)
MKRVFIITLAYTLLLLSLELKAQNLIQKDKPGNGATQSHPITAGGQAGQLDIRSAGENSVRITLKPLSLKDDFPFNPALAEREYPKSFITLRSIDKTVKKSAGNLNITVSPNPLTIVVTNKKGKDIQHLVFDESGKLLFKMNNHPILGLGGGGSKPGTDADWRNLPVEYDRRGLYHDMKPRWQSDAYGTRNPAPMLVGTDGWAMFVAAPWVEVDLKNKDQGLIIPLIPPVGGFVQQSVVGQSASLGKGIPPSDKFIPGLYDIFVFDAHNPSEMMKEYSGITGRAVMPPKWTMGYMQSHRTLEDDKQMIGIVDSFRSKQIPIDAVIYLGSGFTPRGWNKNHHTWVSFEFNPDVFKRNPKEVITDMHDRNVKVVLHMVPGDRDKLPTLRGNIPAKSDEILDASHIQTYWNQHKELLKSGMDAFWPDEGDWFNLYERIKRHQLYYQGPLSSNPNIRPWSLHRNAYPGIAKWGAWVWSGDTEASWKSLETQIAVGLNYSMSIGPFWGTDIGGFFPNEELTGELYARWYQFGAFCPSFRSHGRTWQTRLPWAWGSNDMGAIEHKTSPLISELNNKTIEPVCKKYTELRYQLLSYNYTLAWEARNTGMPMMRSMWLHYPDDELCKKIGDQYMWGSEMLIAPVFQKGAVTRSVYLPEGNWYDWWTNKLENGSKTVTRNVDLSLMPIYVRAGAIIPFDPIRQYTAQASSEPITLKVFSGSDGQYTLYEDDGISQEYLKGKANLTSIRWNDKEKQLTIEPAALKGFKSEASTRTFKIELIPGNEIKTVSYNGQQLNVKF